MGQNPVLSARVLYAATQRGDVLMLGDPGRGTMFGFDRMRGADIEVFVGTPQELGEYWVLVFDPVLIANLDNVRDVLDTMATFVHESVHFEQSQRQPGLFAVDYTLTCDERWDLEFEAYVPQCDIGRAWNLVDGVMVECNINQWTMAGMMTTGAAAKLPHCVPRWRERAAE